MHVSTDYIRVIHVDHYYQRQEYNTPRGDECLDTCSAGEGHYSRLHAIIRDWTETVIVSSVR